MIVTRVVSSVLLVFIVVAFDLSKSWEHWRFKTRIRQDPQGLRAFISRITSLEVNGQLVLSVKRDEADGSAILTLHAQSLGKSFQKIRSKLLTQLEAIGDLD